VVCEQWRWKRQWWVLGMRERWKRMGFFAMRRRGCVGGGSSGAFVRGGFEAVDRGQMEAVRSLGLPYSRAMRRVIMPQGIRIMIPSFINQFIITL